MKTKDRLILKDFTGTIQCEKWSGLAEILDHLFLSGETAEGILSNFGYSGTFKVVSSSMGGIFGRCIATFEIRSVEKEENPKTFEDLYKKYVVRRGHFFAVKGGWGTSKENANRFTEQEAVDFVNKIFCEEGNTRNISIEDAC